MTTISIFSFGGGVQSTAALVLQAQRKLNYESFVFADVGHDSESPETLDYMRDYAIPFAEKHHIHLESVSKTTFGKPETLLEYIYRTEKSIPIPAYMQNGAPGNRSCTEQFKISVIDRWIKQHGYSHAIIGLGISTDEIRRMRDENWHDHHGSTKFGFMKKRAYPLIDLRLSRLDCANIVRDAGLPVPPPSACWFCPFSSRSTWIERRKSNVEVTLPTGETMQVFDAAVELEKHINEKRNSIGRDTVYLHTANKGRMYPLEQAVPFQPSLFDEMGDDDDACESGYCMT